MRTGPVLLIEDDENDVLFMQRAFKATGIENPLHVAKNGQQAVDYLCGVGTPASRPVSMPSLILLDVNMPGMDGFEFLVWLRRKSSLPYLPVVMLSSSVLEKDVAKAYELGANVFVTKPVSSEDRKSLVGALRDFWLRFAELPPPG